MTDQPTHVDVTTHLLVTPKWSDWSIDDSGNPVLKGGTVAKATQGRPTVPRGGGVAVQVTLRIPAGAFLPLQPKAVVVLSMDDLETVVVEADAPVAQEDPR